MEVPPDNNFQRRWSTARAWLLWIISCPHSFLSPATEHVTELFMVDRSGKLWTQSCLSCPFTITLQSSVTMPRHELGGGCH